MVFTERGKAAFMRPRKSWELEKPDVHSIPHDLRVNDTAIRQSTRDHVAGAGTTAKIHGELFASGGGIGCARPALLSVTALGQWSRPDVCSSELDRAFEFSIRSAQGGRSSLRLALHHGSGFFSDMLELRLEIAEMTAIRPVSELVERTAAMVRPV
jgi:hypothetical protein